MQKECTLSSSSIIHGRRIILVLVLYKIPRETSSAAAIHTPGDGNFLYDFRLKSPFISEKLRDRPIITVTD